MNALHFDSLVNSITYESHLFLKSICEGKERVLWAKRSLVRVKMEMQFTT